jgi:hypothetical protein
MATAVRSEPAGHAPGGHDEPLGAYGLLVGTFVLASGVFARWLVQSARTVPEHVGVGDLALVSLASHKASRLITKDRVTSVLRAPFTRYQDEGSAGEVEEAARGHGFRLAVGQLLVCPYCIGMWTAAAFTAGLLAAPRFARWVAFALTAFTVSDFLQIAYKKAEDTL